jgi:hypothetical protein
MPIDPAKVAPRHIAVRSRSFATDQHLSAKVLQAAMNRLVAA